MRHILTHFLIIIIAHDSNDSDKSKTESVTEPRTGLTVPSHVFEQKLVGTSARSVTFLGFLTYAFALYRDANKWNPKEPAKVLTDLLADPTGTTFRIVTYRSIDCTHFCSSISAGTIPKMKKLFESQNIEASKAMEQAESIANDFRSAFKSKDLPVNTAVDFRISRISNNSPDTRVSIYVNGEEQGHIDNNQFTTALVTIYFGNEPKSKEIQVGVQACLDRNSMAK
jgi:hypothetical protein